jgi:hypothetical protein
VRRRTFGSSPSILFSASPSYTGQTTISTHPVSSPLHLYIYTHSPAHVHRQVAASIGNRHGYKVDNRQAFLATVLLLVLVFARARKHAPVYARPHIHFDHPKSDSLSILRPPSPSPSPSLSPPLSFSPSPNPSPSSSPSKFPHLPQPATVCRQDLLAFSAASLVGCLFGCLPPSGSFRSAAAPPTTNPRAVWG